MTFSGDATLAEVIASAKGRAVLVTHLPELLEGSQALRNPDQALNDLPYLWRKRLPALLRDLSRPAEDVWLQSHEQHSMNALDRESFAPRFSPWDAAPEDIGLRAESVTHSAGAPSLSLDGEWQLAGDAEHSPAAPAPGRGADQRHAGELRRRHPTSALDPGWQQQLARRVDSRGQQSGLLGALAVHERIGVPRGNLRRRDPRLDCRRA